MKSTVALIIFSCLMWGCASHVAPDAIDLGYILENLKTIHGEN